MLTYQNFNGTYFNAFLSITDAILSSTNIFTITGYIAHLQSLGKKVVLNQVIFHNTTDGKVDQVKISNSYTNFTNNLNLDSNLYAVNTIQDMSAGHVITDSFTSPYFVEWSNYTGNILGNTLKIEIIYSLLSDNV
jgi:hypothetical protein